MLTRKKVDEMSRYPESGECRNKGLLPLYTAVRLKMLQLQKITHAAHTSTDTGNVRA